jgi:DNA-binding MarR family transcriptional regulator
VSDDFLQELGELALASRLRRLLVWLHRDGVRVYEDLGVDFKPTWFPVFRLIALRPRIVQSQVAEALHMAHPSVIEIVADLVRHGQVEVLASRKDGRRRELRLTARGRHTRKRLEPVWRAFAAAGREVASEHNNNLLASIEKVERALEARSMHQRVLSRLEARAARRSKKGA